MKVRSGMAILSGQKNGGLLHVSDGKHEFKSFTKAGEIVHLNNHLNQQ
jgi:hypothetical protein